MTKEELEKQIEAAFDFRGHVTVRFKSGDVVEGFLFNRQFQDPKLSEDNFVEMFLKGSGDPKKYKIEAIESVALTGEDFAAGNSYEEYLKKKAQKEKKG